MYNTYPFGSCQSSDEPWKVEDRDEEPAIGARRRAKQETHRAVESLWGAVSHRIVVRRCGRRTVAA